MLRNTPRLISTHAGAVIGAPLHLGRYPRSIVTFADRHRRFVSENASAYPQPYLDRSPRPLRPDAEPRPIFEEIGRAGYWRPCAVMHELNRRKIPTPRGAGLAYRAVRGYLRYLVDPEWRYAQEGAASL